MLDSNVLMEGHNRCDLSHRQGVIHPDSKFIRFACDYSHMNEIFDMAAVRTELDRLMKARDIKRKPLAKKAGLGETAIRDIFDEKRSDVRASTLVKLAEFFDVSVDEIAGRGPVPLTGKIGAGGCILFEENPDEETVDRPPLAVGRMMALEVVGTSMFPRYDPGAIVFIRRDHDGVLPEYIGEECAVHLSDGGTFLKILEEGSEPGKYNLRSHNAPPMNNVEVVWASPVLYVKPRPRRRSS